MLSSFLICSFFGYSQNIAQQKFNIPQVQAALSSTPKTVDPDFLKASKINSKAFGDTLIYEDFNGGLPVGWSVVNNNPNPFGWRWDTVYTPGAFSLNVPTFSSTTASNGFMVLNAGFFNTPIPPTGAVAMYTSILSGSIDLTKNGANPNGLCNVWVKYQQSLRYCCSSSSRLELHVSTDNFVTWTGYDASNAIAINAASGTMTNTINISSAAANATSIKVRILAEGMTHYYWMIDDFAIIEGPKNDLEIRRANPGFNYDYTFNPFYSQIPYDLFTPLRLSGVNYNNGCNTLTGVHLEGDFIHVKDPMGNPGLGNVLNVSSSSVTLNPYQLDSAVYNSPLFVPLVLGEFRVDIISNSDSIDENLGNETYSHTFTTSDTIFARDDNGYGGGTGPGDYQGAGTAIGDKFGTMYIIESRTGNGGTRKIPTSITFAVSNDSANLGVEILPRIWSFDENAITVNAAFTGLVATSFIPYTILAIDTLLTLRLDNGTAIVNGLDSGQYVVGWEVTNTNGGNSFEVYEDASSLPFQDDVTCFVDIASAPAGWSWVRQNPVIRLNMGNLPVPTGLKTAVDSNLIISVHPNPSNGEFSLTYKTNEKSTFLLTIRNALGQLIHSEQPTINGKETKQFNFTHLEKGVYYISLQNESENRVETVVIH